MSVQELKQAYAALPEKDQLVFASLIAADQLARQPDFAACLGVQVKRVAEL